MGLEIWKVNEFAARVVWPRLITSYLYLAARSTYSHPNGILWG
jgi:hypothetical protein